MKLISRRRRRNAINDDDYDDDDCIKEGEKILLRLLSRPHKYIFTGREENFQLYVCLTMGKVL